MMKQLASDKGVAARRQKKIAVINDLTGFGRCSLTVSLPIISAMKVQCCPVPTSIFSNHTAYDSWFFDDFTDRMQPYIDEWKKLQLSFDGISTGFLGSEEQIQIVLRFLDDFATEDTVVIVDPVMGDDGKPYSTYTAGMCAQMKQLVMRADILTPNLTEACILTGREYHKGKWRTDQVIALAEELAQMGPEKVVITGIPQGEFIANLCYEKKKACPPEVEAAEKTQAVGVIKAAEGKEVNGEMKATEGKKANGEKAAVGRAKRIGADTRECASGQTDSEDDAGYAAGVRFVRTHKVGTQRCGTGDVFSAIIAADAVNGADFQESVRKASHFVKLCIQKSIEFDLPLTDGVCFEELLGTLCKTS